MKTIKTVEIDPVFLDGYLPENKDLEFGKLYISREYFGIKHLCLCGCGEPTFIPLQSINGEGVGERDGWILTEKNGKITLTPSLLHRFECKSHYIITNNKANFV